MLMVLCSVHVVISTKYDSLDDLLFMAGNDLCSLPYFFLVACFGFGVEINL